MSERDVFVVNVSLGSFAAMLCVAGLARATTYQVGPGQAYSSLASVAGKLAPGDIVEVQGDATYGSVSLQQAGTASAKITIRGIRVNGKRPVFSGGTNTIEAAGDHYVLEGLDLTGGSSRCLFHHADDITVRDTVIHDCPAQGILSADEDSGSLTLQYVEVYKCGDADKKHQLYLASDESAHPGSVFRMEHCYVHDGNGGNNVKSRAERNEIYYNWIEGAYYRELELIGPDGQDPGKAREDSDVVGNVLRKTSNGYVARLGGDGTGDTSGRYRFVNNTIIITNGSSTVFQLFDSIESVEMHNNVIYATGGGAKIYTDSDASWTTGSAIITGSTNWILSGCSAVPTAWTGTISGSDPGFTDMSRANLIPLPGSALVDRGTMPTTSPSGHSFASPLAGPGSLPPPAKLEAVDGALARPVSGSIDIGAYEFGSSSTGAGGSSGGAGGARSGGAGGAMASGGSNASGSGGSPSGAGGAPASGNGGNGGRSSGTGGGQASLGGTVGGGRVGGGGGNGTSAGVDASSGVDAATPSGGGGRSTGVSGGTNASGSGDASSGGGATTDPGNSGTDAGRNAGGSTKVGAGGGATQGGPTTRSDAGAAAGASGESPPSDSGGLCSLTIPRSNSRGLSGWAPFAIAATVIAARRRRGVGGGVGKVGEKDTKHS